jgi:hypothetical protein
MEPLETRCLLAVNILDAVNAVFEAPSVGAGLAYGPIPASGWTFTAQSPAAGSGIAGNGSSLTAGNPAAPEGTQVAFLQGTGRIAQDVPGWQTGTEYVVAFSAARRANGAGLEDFQVLLDGTPLTFQGATTITPSSTSYASQVSDSVNVAASGNHVLSFVGIDSAGQDDTALIDNVQIIARAPAPWSDADVGQTGLPGASAFQAAPSDPSMPGASHTLLGGGTGLGGTADSAHVLAQPLLGDGTIVARIDGESNTSSSAQAGVMVRDGSDPGAPFAAVVVAPGGAVSFIWRSAAGQASQSSPPVATTAPAWVELVRSGNAFTASVSEDGQTWTPVGQSETIVMPASVSADLVDASGDPTQLNRANFSDVDVHDIGGAPFGGEAGPEFVDIIKSGVSGFYQANFNYVPATLDANGWPTQDFQFLFVQRGAPAQVDGVWTLVFNGQATIQWNYSLQNPSYGYTVLSQNYNATTNTTTAKLLVNFTNPDVSQNYAQIFFTQTQQTATSAWGTGVTNIQLIRPGYDPSNHPLYTPESVAALSEADLIRVMGWSGTNGSTEHNWSDRLLPTAAQISAPGKMVPWEYVIALANAAHRDLWLNIPEEATNDYITQLAELIKNGDTVGGVTYAGLDPSLNLYIEHSNEVWNGGFAANGQAAADGQAYETTPFSTLGYEPVLNDDGTLTTSSAVAERWHVMRVVDIGLIFGSVFGAGEINTRIRPILGTFIADNPLGTWHLIDDDANLAWVDRNFGPVSSYIYGIAVSAYWGASENDFFNGVRARTNWTENDWITQWQNNVATFADPNSGAYHSALQFSALAHNYGLKLTAYEGGLGIADDGRALWNNSQATASLTAALNDPRLGAIIQQDVNTWYGLGADQFNWFTLGAGGAGSYSTTDSFFNLADVRLAAIDAVRTTPLPPVTAGYDVSQPVEIDGRGTVDQVAPSLQTASQLFTWGGYKYTYLLRADVAGTYYLRLSAGNWSGVAQTVDVTVNDGAVQTLSCAATANWNTYQDSSILAVSLKAGLNALRLETPNGDINLDSILFVNADGSGVPNTMPSLDGSPYGGSFTIAQGTSLSNWIGFSDAQTADPYLTITATSDNPALLPSGSIVFSGTWGGRTFTITPAPTGYGVAHITFTVTNGVGLSRSEFFTLYVTPASGTNLAQGAATESSADALGSSAALATDGNTTTGWTSPAADGHWIIVDLGQDISLSTIKLTWGANYATSFVIQTADADPQSGALYRPWDPQWTPNWVDVAGGTVTSGTGGVETLSGLSGIGRWVRLKVVSRSAATQGVTLDEFEIYGTPASAATLQAPAAPSGLVATAVSAHQVKLSWVDNATDEKSDVVQRATDPAFTQNLTTIATTLDGATSAVDLTTAPSTTYYYRVEATNDAGASAFATTPATTPADTLPAAPSELAATTVVAGEVDLVWSNNSPNATGFVIQRASDAAFTQNVTAFNVGAGVTSYSDVNVPAGSLYYRVQAVNTAGSSAVSNVASPASGAPNIHAAGLAVNTLVGTQYSAPVAFFLDDEPGVTASSFTASIAWGDGSTSSGTVAAVAGGGYQVSGAHTYASSAATWTTIIIQGPSGRWAVASAAALVSMMWTGGGDGVSFQDPNNWNADRVPTTGDNVVINTAGITINSTASVSIRSIESQAALNIESGTFSLSGGSSTISAALTVAPGATLSADATGGTGTALTVSGATVVDSSNLIATNGATISLPGASGYSGVGTFEASGTGSVLSLPNLASLSAGSNANTGRLQSVILEALAGGTVSLPAVTQISGGPVGMEADGANSLLNLSSLAAYSFNPADNVFGSTQGPSSIQASNGGTIDLTTGSLDLADTVVTLTSTGSLQVGTLIVDAGSILTGSGQLPGNLVDAGLVEPTGQITVMGTYTQTAAGTLDFVLSGLQAGTSFGQLTVNGSATLGGDLSASLANGFTPAAGNSFAVLSFGSSSDYFTSYSGLSMPGNQELDPSLTSTSLTLTTNNVVNLSLTTSAQELNTGEASQPFTLELQDQNGNPTTVGAGGLIIILSTTSPGGSFLNGSGQALPIAAITVPAGASSVSFEYLDADTGSPTITALAPSGSSQSQQEAVNVPLANSGTASLNENAQTTIHLTGTDPNSLPLTYSIVGGPAHGALTYVSNGVYTYTPNTYYNGSDSFTFDANDGLYTSNTATISITVVPVNQQPKATAQTVALGNSGALPITLQGTDIETPTSQLVYTIASLPSTGTLMAGGSAATVGETFVGSAAVLSYLQPTEVFGAFSTSFTFTVTDNGDPAGTVSNALTSAPATVTIQTPASPTGVLRISGGLGNNAFALSETSGNTNLHVLVNGTSAGSDIPFSSLKQIELFGDAGTNTYTIPAGLPVPITVVGGTGSDTLTTGANNLTFTGGTGSAAATITLDSNAGSASLSPGAGSITDGSDKIALTNVATITIKGNANDTAHLSDSAGSNTLTAGQTSATFSGTGFSNTVAGFAQVYATAAAGTTDTASLSDSSGSNRFTATPGSAYFSGAAFYNKATGFASYVGQAGAGTSDLATLSDSSGTNSFAATPTSATFSGNGFSEAANGFVSVTATAASGTTDSATLTSSAGNDTFTASPGIATMIGTGYSDRANGFVSVTGNAAGSSDTAHLSDTSGSNTLTAGSSSAVFSGTGFSETANGFATVFGTAAAGTTDTAKLSDTSGKNTFTATPAYALFSGQGFYNRASGFVSVTATAAVGTTDTTTLTDASGKNTFTATPTSATFSGTGFSDTANGFTSVTANAASGTTDSAILSTSSGNDTFSASPGVATMIGTGYSDRANGFATMVGNAVGGGSDTAHLSDKSGSNTLTATQTSATFSGTGFSETANGFGVVFGTAVSGTTDTAKLSDTSGKNSFTATPAYGLLSGKGFYNKATGFVSVTATAAAGTTDTATLSDSSGSNKFTGTPTSGLFSGSGFSNQATGFLSVVATAAAGTTDTATLSDTSGSNTFKASPTAATFSGTGFSNTVNGFSSVTANAAAGTTDAATLNDSSGNDTFTASPTIATMKGTGYSNRANGFASVTGISSAGGTDSAHLSDTSGSNTFTATQTTAKFTGGGFTETATGFGTVYGTAVTGTTDTATLSDSSGSNKFTGTPTSGLFYGTSFYNQATGFVSVVAKAAAGTTDTATLSDTTGSNIFTAGPTSAMFSGAGFSNTVNGFSSVIANAAAGTTDAATLNDSSGNDTFTASPTIATMKGTGYSNRANGFASMTGISSAGGTDSAHLSDTSGSNTFTATQTTAKFTGTGFTETANGFGTVYGTTVTGTTDTATLSDSSGSNHFVGMPTYGLFYGTGFYNQATGFVSVVAKATAGTTDTATLSDTSGSNTFTAGPTSATFSGMAFSNSANGFSSVIANAASGTTDAATLNDSSGNDTFTASPTVATMKGMGYSNRANGFSSVTGISSAGGTDSAHLSDTSGSNTFTATPTTAKFTGGGFTETATGFGAMYGTASAGTTDAATLSDASGGNTFTATPTSGVFSGTNFYNVASGFVSVTGIASPGTSDTAKLSDTSGSNTFTSSPTAASFTGPHVSETANGFAKVTATAASGTTDTATFTDSPSSAGTFTGSPTSSSMAGSGWNNVASGFVSVTATAVNSSDVANLSDNSSGAQFNGSATLGTLAGSNYTINVTAFGTINLTGSSGSNKAHLNAIDYVLHELGTWTSD